MIACGTWPTAPPPFRSPPLTGHSGDVKALAFSPDGRNLASGSADPAVMMWDVTDRTRPLRLAILPGHGDNRVTSVAFSPDGRTLAAGSRERHGAPVGHRQPGRTDPARHDARRPRGEARSLAFRRDGRTLAVTSQTNRATRDRHAVELHEAEQLRADPARSRLRHHRPRPHRRRVGPADSGTPVPAHLRLTPTAPARPQKARGRTGAVVYYENAMDRTPQTTHRRLTAALLRVLAVTATAAPLALTGTAASAAPGSQPGTFVGYGFDACTAPSSATMTAWLASPYRAVGIYFGGVNRGCTQPNLTAAWVAEQQAAGWHLIPLYVGPQASCTTSAKTEPHRQRAGSRPGPGRRAGRGHPGHGAGTRAGECADLRHGGVPDRRRRLPGRRLGVHERLDGAAARPRLPVRLLQQHGLGRGRSGGRLPRHRLRPARLPRLRPLGRGRHRRRPGRTGRLLGAAPPDEAVPRRPQGDVGRRHDQHRQRLPRPRAAAAHRPRRLHRKRLVRRARQDHQLGQPVRLPGNGGVVDTTAAVRIGGGWQATNAIIRIGDLDRDGHEDVVARQSANGDLWFHPGTGTGSAPASSSAPPGPACARSPRSATSTATATPTCWPRAAATATSTCIPGERAPRWARGCWSAPAAGTR